MRQHSRASLESPATSLLLLALSSIRASQASEYVPQDLCPGSGDTECVKWAVGVVDHVTTEGWVAGANPNGMNVFRLYLELSGNAESVYAIFGDSADCERPIGSTTGCNPMDIPGAHQEATGGTDIGGVNPMFFSFMPELQFDSWLTLGTDAATEGIVAYEGFEFDNWDDQNRLYVTDGTVFWLDPANGPSTGDNDGAMFPGDVASDRILVAQLVMSSSIESWSALMSATGRQRNFVGPGYEGSWLWMTTGIEFWWDVDGASPPTECLMCENGAQFQSCTELMNDVCCTGPDQDCSTGDLSSCNTQCAEVFIEVQGLCDGCAEFSCSFVRFSVAEFSLFCRL